MNQALNSQSGSAPESGTAPRIYVSEELWYEFQSTPLARCYTGRDGSAVAIVAEAHDSAGSYRKAIQRIFISRTLQHCDPFRQRVDTEEILVVLGVTQLKQALRNGTAEGVLPEISLGTDNWKTHLKAERGKLIPRMLEVIAVGDRQIAKRLLIQTLSNVSAPVTVGALARSLRISTEALEVALLQLKGMGLVHQDGSRWCIANEGEILVARGMLEQIFPMDPSSSQMPGGTSSNTYNITVNQSSIGVLNAGTIDKLNGDIACLLQNGSEELANAFKLIAEAIADNKELPPEESQGALELIEDLAAEASKVPSARRGMSSIKASFGALGQTLSATGGLAEIWNVWGPQIAAFLGLTEP